MDEFFGECLSLVGGVQLRLEERLHLCIAQDPSNGTSPSMTKSAVAMSLKLFEWWIAKPMSQNPDKLSETH